MEMILINQLSAGVCRVYWRQANPTVNHICSQWAAPSCEPRLSRSLHTAVGSLLPGTCKDFLRTDGGAGKARLTFHADI